MALHHGAAQPAGTFGIAKHRIQKAQRQLRPDL